MLSVDPVHHPKCPVLYRIVQCLLGSSCRGVGDRLLLSDPDHSPVIQVKTKTKSHGKFKFSLISEDRLFIFHIEFDLFSLWPTRINHRGLRRET